MTAALPPQPHALPVGPGQTPARDGNHCNLGWRFSKADLQQRCINMSWSSSGLLDLVLALAERRTSLVVERRRTVEGF